MEINSKAPLPPDAFASFFGIIEAFFSLRKKDYSNERSLNPERVKRAFDLLQGTAEDAEKYAAYQEIRFDIHNYLAPKPVLDRVLEFVGRPDVKLVHVIRLLVLTRNLYFIDIVSGVLQIGYLYNTIFDHFNKTHNCRINLLDVAAACAASGISADAVGWLRMSWTGYDFMWEDSLVWPYFAEHLHILEEILGVRPASRQVASYEKSPMREKALDVIAMFPQPPASLVPALWEIALGTNKTEKPLAIRILDKHPDSKEKLVEALGAGKQEARAGAAEWLARIGAKDAVPAIQAALKKEKQDIAKAAMMNALERLGVPLGQYLNADELLKEAKAGLVKGIPEALSWFKSDQLPTLHWNDSGEEIPKEITTWWIVQSNKMANPEPMPVLRCYCSLLKKEDREALGIFVLESWITRDTTPTYTQEQAEALAKKLVSGHTKPFSEWTPEQQMWYRSCLKGYIDECLYSAIKEKGILAVAAACGGPKIAPVAERYLKRWYGIRAAQSKALIRMLGWVEHKTATQLLLAISSRFRTKGIREEAEICVNALAERKGWTLDELADRTIPTGGFDQGPEMTLGYGSRSFTARFDEKFNIIVKDEGGSVINSLPDASKSDDSEKVKEAKKLLSDAKKELKSVAKAQKERLYEAMCTQRAWSYDDWNTYLLGHPIIRYYCQKLVWSAFDGGKETRFRPLDDGTLSDHQDSEVKLSEDAVIKIAHACNTPEEERNIWLAHFRDYELEFLFGQFTKPLYELPEDMKEQTDLLEFEGHMIEAFKLRNKAASLGYSRGSTEDGGWFYCYTRRFTGLGVEATIEFSGNELPEQNKMVALKELCFTRITAGNGASGGYIKLGDIPTAMLSECHCDLSLIAAEGTGFDPDWERKTE